MTTERKTIIAYDTTVKIFAAILEEQNGYTKEEIKKNKLAEDCEGAEIWTRIYDAVFSAVGKRK